MSENKGLSDLAARGADQTVDPIEDLMEAAVNENKNSYELPDLIADDPGLALRYVLTVNFPESPSQALQERFKISRQTAWIWCKAQDGGVPMASRKILFDLTPKHPEEGDTWAIRLPKGITGADLLRRGSILGRQPFTKRNQYLLNLLCEVVSGRHEDLELGTLDALVSSHLRMLVSAHRIWQWAYVQGGIPESYVTAALKGMIHYGFHRALDMDAKQFAVFVRRHLVNPKAVSPQAQQPDRSDTGKSGAQDRDKQK